MENFGLIPVGRGGLSGRKAIGHPPFGKAARAPLMIVGMLLIWAFHWCLTRRRAAGSEA